MPQELDPSEKTWLLGLFVLVVMAIIAFCARYMYHNPFESGAFIGVIIGFFVVPYVIGEVTRQTWRELKK